jgi:hypothetical protein
VPDYFADGCVIDQPFQRALSEGVVRCYMAGDRCAGFGHQKVKGAGRRTGRRAAKPDRGLHFQRRPALPASCAG